MSNSHETQENLLRDHRGSRLTLATAMLAGLLLGGCTSPQHQEPTHRWVSTDNASSAQYRVDNGYCRKIVGDRSQRSFEVNTPEYEKYTACMRARNYTLSAYNETPASSR